MLRDGVRRPATAAGWHFPTEPTRYGEVRG